MLPISTEKLHTYYKTCRYRVCTDTRNIIENSIFFCLKGANFNGNLFAKDALSKGAAYVVADEEDACTDERILYVPDALKALQDLATFHREHIDTQILAIGGSNGKTTTKELCLAVLETTLKVKATQGNLNNHIGVPLTLLGLDGTEDVAVIELGTNHPGEMKLLCDITNADAGIVTNVGKEHLEGFGSLENVAREESELYLSLMQENGLAFVNVDDTWLGNMGRRLQNKFTYGIENTADLQGKVLQSMPNLVFTLQYNGNEYGPFEAKLGGAYNLYNILAAVATGIHYGISLELAAKAACLYSPSNNRSEWRKINGKHVLLDAYNANPSSMELALQEFAGMKGDKCVFLGDMLELGEHAAAEHKSIATLVKDLGLQTWFSGPEFCKATNTNHAFENTDLLLDHLKQHPISAEYVLIKGSRGMRMEKLLDVL